VFGWSFDGGVGLLFDAVWFLVAGELLYFLVAPTDSQRWVSACQAYCAAWSLFIGFVVGISQMSD